MKGNKKPKLHVVRQSYMKLHEFTWGYMKLHKV